MGTWQVWARSSSKSTLLTGFLQEIAGQYFQEFWVYCLSWTACQAWGQRERDFLPSGQTVQDFFAWAEQRRTFLSSGSRKRASLEYWVLGYTTYGLKRARVRDTLTLGHYGMRLFDIGCKGAWLLYFACLGPPLLCDEVLGCTTFCLEALGYETLKGRVPLLAAVPTQGGPVEHRCIP